MLTGKALPAQCHERRPLSRLLSPGHEVAQLGPGDLHLEREWPADPVESIHYGMTKSAEISKARGLAELMAGTNVP